MVCRKITGSDGESGWMDCHGRRMAFEEKNRAKLDSDGIDEVGRPNVKALSHLKVKRVVENDHMFSNWVRPLCWMKNVAN